MKRGEITITGHSGRISKQDVPRVIVKIADVFRPEKQTELEVAGTATGPADDVISWLGSSFSQTLPNLQFSGAQHSDISLRLPLWGSSSNAIQFNVDSRLSKLEISRTAGSSLLRTDNAICQTTTQGLSCHTEANVFGAQAVSLQMSQDFEGKNAPLQILAATKSSAFAIELTKGKIILSGDLLDLSDFDLPKQQGNPDSLGSFNFFVNLKEIKNAQIKLFALQGSLRIEKGRWREASFSALTEENRKAEVRLLQAGEASRLELNSEEANSLLRFFGIHGRLNGGQLRAHLRPRTASLPEPKTLVGKSALKTSK